jgi:DNA-binding NtrC family response regulator
MTSHVQSLAHDAPARPRVLIVDDEPELVRMLGRMLEPEGFEVLEASDPSEMSRKLELEPELVLLDLQLGDVSAIDLIGLVRHSSCDSELIVMTGYASVDSAVTCIRAGAFDYLEKPFERGRVVQTLRRAVDQRALRVRDRDPEPADAPVQERVQAPRRAQRAEGERSQELLGGIVCQSQAMRRVVQTVLDLHANQSTVLIEAESGTGKELVARAIHDTSLRCDGPFVPLDCGALPEGIAEGELFGYERGAFTGAVRAAPGVFRSADGGTLFLDEVGELSPFLQAKLLRALQEREVRPLGADRAVSVDVRIVAATNRDLEDEVRRGRFRSDLYYRLRVVPLRLPPLRERPDDIPVLALHFLRRAAGERLQDIEAEALEALMSRPWLGNVRELENAIEAAAALARGPRLRAEDLGLGAARADAPQVTRPEGIGLSMQAYERACLEQALRHAEGDVRRAARLLGIGRSTLYRKLREHGLQY